MKEIRYALRRFAKWGMIHLILAPYYKLCCLRPVQPGLAVLADGHQDTIPYSMTVISERLKQKSGLQVVEYYHDYSFCGAARGLGIMLRFIPLYARAQFVFICDYFVPTACGKRKGTTLIQLWHSGGLMKKLGLDSPEDSKGFLPSMYAYTDVFTASSALVSDVLSGAIGLPRERFSQAGVTRMDLLYDAERTREIRLRFEAAHPELVGKKLILWTPTFRGNVQDAYLIGAEEILRLQKELPADYAVLIKTHRFANRPELNSVPDFSSDELLTLADAMITDYSSIYFDYLYYRKPIILFAPDLEDYDRSRGLYIDYRQVPGCLAMDYGQLYRAVTEMDVWADEDYRRRLDALWEEQMDYCDGHSCEKLMRQLGLD